jgi:hypothetical protein
MSESFGDYLLKETDAMDFINREYKKEVFYRIYRYFEDICNIKFMAVLSETNIENQMGLKTLWVHGGHESSRKLRGDNNEIQGQAAFAYCKNLNLWIVCDNGKVLNSKDSKYLDIWSDTPSQDIPIYKDKAMKSIKNKTSIIMPLVDSNNFPFGVVNFESITCQSIDEEFKDEFLKMVKVIQRVILLCRSNKIIQEGRNKIKTRLTNYDHTLFKPIIHKPKLFLSFAEDCDSRVVQELIGVLHDNNIKYVDWRKISDNGRITSHIIQEIRECRIGICYLSEKLKEKCKSKDIMHKYVDNPNVLFEAGMLCGLASNSRNPNEIAVNWIPIREKDSPELPFNIQSERILIVPRNEKGELNEERFKKEIMNRVTRLVEK